jgi:hypothetical protein
VSLAGRDPYTSTPSREMRPRFIDRREKIFKSGARIAN